MLELLTHPLTILLVGIAAILGLIIVLRANAFLALLTAAALVSLLAPGPLGDKINRVASAFGTSAGRIGIVIALAAVIGECLMLSGAADRVVRAFLHAFGERRAAFALLASGYVLAVPVFFDTVFYLLVPLARSLYKRTGKDYLLYILAIAAGGAVTHTLVPPTPGPLLMAATLRIDIGLMILAGAAVALPAALAGLAFARYLNRRMPIPLREGTPGADAVPPDDADLPPLFWSALPVLLPVVLISVNTVFATMARGEATAAARPRAVVALVGSANASPFPAAALVAMTEPAVQRAGQAAPPQTTLQQFAEIASLIGDPNLALFLSALVAMIVLVRKRRMTLRQLEPIVERALLSAGVIILITAAGGAFGAMLTEARVGPAIEGLFGAGGRVGGLMLLALGFLVAAVLKVAQGSSTVAMITASGMLAGMAATPQALGFDPVYLALAIGSGSLVGSWMNDSGFWIVSKMGGLTEVETLRSWTLLLIVLGCAGFACTILLALLLPYPTG